ncbi:NirD/YgiW/YdeI family stress tolerance protein [Aliivibrio sp. S4TY2]|uniref:NirD/YgiW/YdeI family stress tolerance protein n=1 Tax=Aliivibrio finisterrensis TaxID=511998 RepID=A0A4V1Z8Y3_9GAMM|nr:MULTISPECIES: NirD/YgiW/YdeI family stress tolerance protein [Aliivibrio]MDD9154905.1 NirD/YgiW/YdeI family stress tolerance protein [Aliivibrio sp. S4TY2]MDD9158732.1 NirD/YgiW/YdeI family stress tolerance protein [Aliivibrio sp. S4TY1]MDD9162908.1 NirD/YgiW/YdeI family stress tolerance protein [Aliivibrio sp. S4MY2]MDD9166731.1 NirD/YgiW/YdeI family stress tolerance protein [Aliivibrio sp. S4MY4]MDD9177876.1 NirD/YgiW/YdeI family stress tolerance protein [Aliivibrio sp. A6]
MKKIILASALVLASSTAFAAQNAPVTGGFNGPSSVSVSTVRSALDSADDAAVVLTGYITSSLGNEEYQFKDATGEIRIEIDNKDWNGIEATPETKLVIHGEVDKEWTETMIDVNSVQLAK